MPTIEEEQDVSRIGAGEKPKEEMPEEEEDSEQQKFYEDLVDLKDIIPAVLLTSGKSAADTSGDAEAKPERPAEDKEKPKDAAASDFELYLMRVSKAESGKQVDEIVVEFFHDFNTKGNRQRLAAHLYGACIPDGMIVSQLCAVDGFYCNFCWRLIRSSSCIYWRHMRALQRWLGLTSKMYPIS
eukprot:symbB.v1.2.017467.t1/scaffold1361.1/size175804/7